jgi:hypothetical protein
VESCRTARLDKSAARLAGCREEMIQITAQMRVLVAIEPVDGRKGMDSLEPDATIEPAHREHYSATCARPWRINFP